MKSGRNIPNRSQRTMTKKFNELDAKVITAQTEIERLDEQIKEINRQMTDLNDNKGFLNRKKSRKKFKN